MHEFLDQRADDHDADADRHGIPADGRIDIEHNLLARFLADTFGTGCRRNQAGRKLPVAEAKNHVPMMSDAICAGLNRFIADRPTGLRHSSPVVCSR